MKAEIGTHDFSEDLAPATERQTRRCAPGRSRIGPAELATWLRARLGGLADRWSREIHSRELAPSEEFSPVIDRFVAQLVTFLPWMLGAYREQVEPLWIRSCELFGVMAAKRGLAAGEVIEEFQILRELVIRDLYRDPPLGGRLPLSLREILRLNRGIDRGVTHASVGHTDAMFFRFFEESDEHAERAADVAGETQAQLAAITEELDVIVRHARAKALARRD